MFVKGRHQLKEQVRGVLLEGQVADLVDDDQPVTAQPGELLREQPLPVRVGETGDPVRRGREQHPMPVPGGDDPEGDGEDGLAGSGWAEPHHVLRFEEEPAGRESCDLLPDGRLRIPVEVLQRLAGREPGALDPQLRPGRAVNDPERAILEGLDRADYRTSPNSKALPGRFLDGRMQASVKGDRRLRVWAPWGSLCLGASMYTYTVRLMEVRCFRTESVHSSDKFALAGSVFSGKNAVGVALPLMRMNNGDQRDLSGFEDYTYTVQSLEPEVGISLQGWDLDQNEGWPEARDKALEMAGMISSAIVAVPGWGAGASAVISATAPIIAKALDWVVAADKDDHLIDYREIVGWPHAPGPGVETVARELNPHFRTDNYHYSLTIHVTRTSSSVSFPTSKPAPENMIGLFQTVNQRATLPTNGWVGAFPTGQPSFRTANQNLYRPVIAFDRGQATWKDVPLREMGNPSLNDFRKRMGAANTYAREQGYEAAFPNYFHADHGAGIVCGTLLLPDAAITRKQFSFASMPDGLDVDDTGAVFRAVHNWAVENGFLGGFPTYFEAPKGLGGSFAVAGLPVALINHGRAQYVNLLMALGEH
jgi:hypothetical protein